MRSDARLATPNGSRYLQQLCKHFAHKIEVEYSATEGRCALPPGPALMKADEESLWIEVTAPDEEGLTRAKSVIDSHLARFAYREEVEAMPWGETRA
ncbi:DUF2218 domain-containing protein [Pseudoroseicyclus tamaricis]|uniref:DUF2218 domain-containing protein n=1 Tax=Pseudoroseicyclus tamaricis TaxID=2705421 RepID=A0A6B2K0V5_9RHOB|nr:DUF2218 domain-containing protein [Pseudoroseicyclus tamaricis]NDV01322.1 DUF2218 domain-containing protein [Pseudoroseicyclus tamaricis]